MKKNKDYLKYLLQTYFDKPMNIILTDTGEVYYIDLRGPKAKSKLIAQLML